MLLSLAVSERLLVCIRVVEEFGLVEEGIFRKAGPKMEVDLLSTILVDGESAFSVVERDIGVPEAAAAAGAAEEEEEENEETASAAAEPFVSSASTPLEAQLRNVTTVHSVAGALKRVLRNHHPLLCCELYASWVSGARDWEVARDEELPVIPPLLRQCAARLPPVHLAVLERLVHCVGAVLDHGENRMTMKSVAITLGINILHSGDLMALPDIPAIENVLNALLDVAQLSNDRRKGVANEEAIGYEETDDVQPGPLAAIARTMSKVLKMDGIAVVDDASVAAFYAAKSGSDSDDDDTYSAPRKLKSKSASEVMSEIRHELKAGRKFIKREISSAALSAVTDEKSEALQQKRAAHKSAMALAHAASAARQQQSQQRRVLARKLKKRNRKASSNRFDANFAWWEEEEGLAEERLAQTDVVVQLLRTPVALPTVGEIHVVEDDAKLKPKVKPKGAAASPPSRHRPAGAAPAPPVPPAARPKGAAPPPPVPATPSLTDMLRIAPDALLVRLLEYKLDVDAAQEKSARNILRLTELSRALDEHWHGKTEHYFGCDDLSRRPSHTVGGVGAAAAAAAAAAGASPAAKPKAKLKTAPSLKMKIKDVKREVKSVVAGGAPSESMMTTLLRNRGRRQTLMRWGLAQLPAVKAAFAQQYECQSRWIALHAEAESAFADALLAKQDAIESMIEHYDLRSIVHAAGNGGGSGGGSKSNAVQRLMSSTFHKVGSMQQRAKVTSSLAKVRSALTRGKPGAEKASAAAGISTAGGSRNVSILTVERRFFASLEDMREAVQLGKASHHQHSVKIASSAVAAVAPKSAPPGEYAAEAASLRGRIEAANAQVVGLQQTLMPRSFEERAASLKTSVEVFMHTKACIAAAKTARITPPPLAEGEDAECEARKVAVSVSRARGKASAVNDASDQMKRQVRGDGKTAAAIAQFCAVVLDERTTHGRWAWALIDECRTTLNAGGGGGGDATAAAGADAEDEYDDGMPQKSYTDMLITFCTGRLAKVRGGVCRAVRFYPTFSLAFLHLRTRHVLTHVFTPPPSSSSSSSSFLGHHSQVQNERSRSWGLKSLPRDRCACSSRKPRRTSDVERSSVCRPPTRRLCCGARDDRIRGVWAAPLTPPRCGRRLSGCDE